MDKADDSEASRQVRHEQGVEAVIPSKTNRRKAIPSDNAHDQCRHKVEGFFNQLTHCRRLATRYDKLRRTFLACIHRVATWVMIR